VPRGLRLLLATAGFGRGHPYLLLALGGRGGGQAGAGIRAGASRVCLVASGRGPSARDVDRVAGVVDRLKAEYPGVEVCTCLGLLQDGQADRLKTAGADAYNHNVNTSESRYAELCSTHGHADRVETVRKAKAAGLSPCSRLIVGMGETDDEIIDAIFAVRDLDADSIPINFLMPFDGTPLAGTWLLTPARCLRILAVGRFACPATEIRVAGGREMHLRSLQPLALPLADSLFLGDYLTSEGQAAPADLAMIADAGLRVLSRQSEPTRRGSRRRDPAAARRRRRIRPQRLTGLVRPPSPFHWPRCSQSPSLRRPHPPAPEQPPGHPARPAGRPRHRARIRLCR